MRSPVNQQQQRTLAPRAAPSAPDQEALCGREICLFESVLQSYGLEPAPPRLQVGVTPLLQSDGTVQWQVPNWQLPAQEMDMHDYPTQQPPTQQTSTQQVPTQEMTVQYRFFQQMPPQQMPAQQMQIQQMPAQHMDMLTQPMSMQNMSMQQMQDPGIYAQQTTMYQRPMEQVPSQHTQWLAPQHPANASPLQAASCISTDLPPGHKFCINCHGSFDIARNHDMACVRHKHDMPVVDDKAAEWQDWDDEFRGPKDCPSVREQFPNAFVWPCCLRSGKAPGCMSDVHVPQEDELHSKEDERVSEGDDEFVMEAVMWAANAEKHGPDGGRELDLEASM